MKVLPKLFIVCLLSLMLHLAFYASGVIPFFDFRFFDVLSLNRETPFSSDSGATVVVEIDESSLQQLGQWPWPRIMLAKAVQEILYQQPAAIGLDVLFPEPDRTSPRHIELFYRQLLGVEVELTGFPPALADHDRVFAEVLSSGPTVLPLFAAKDQALPSSCSLEADHLLELPPDTELPYSNNLLCNTALLQGSARGFGFINASVDSDGVFRRQPLLLAGRNGGIPSLALAMLMQVDPALQIMPQESGRSPLQLSFLDHTVKANQRGEILNQLYPKQAFTRVSVIDLIRGEVSPDIFRGKFVLIGASAAGLFDQYMTSTGKVLPGVFTHAALLENLLADQTIYQTDRSKLVALFLSGFCSLIVIWLVLERRYLLSWALYLAFSASSIVCSILALNRGIYLSLGYFLTPLSFLFFIISLFFAVLHYVERKRFLEDLGAAHSATIDSMTMVAESRDVETGAHIIRTKEYIRLLAEALREKGLYTESLSPRIIDLLYRAAPLHDIGKVGIPDAILQKPAKLEEHELEVMQSHVAIGRSIIENAINNYNKTNEFLSIASHITYSHHEKWDGSGYPLGLQGEEIPIEGRLMALVDVYDALISRRCYKEPLSFQAAEQIIISESGKHFDPMVVQIFHELKESFRLIALKYQEGQNQISG